MGNTLLEVTDKYPLKQFDSWTEQKPELSGGKLLFQSKIFHTMSFNLKTQSASIVMKVYLKESDFDSRNSQAYRDQFELLRKRFNPMIYPNLLPFMTLLNFDQYQPTSNQGINFVVVARQQMYQTLSDRFIYKPSLNPKEKQWILFQTLIALYCVHRRENLFHGAIRSSNILLTTSNHVFLTDFANYKPIHIDEDNQIRDLRFFYKTHENNSTLAPEKFQSSIKHGILPLDQIPPDLLNSLQLMDIFSLGCVIADLYFEGEQPLFTYEQVQKFKSKTYDPEPIIQKIADKKIRNLVSKIILEENYANRMPIEKILEYFMDEIVENKEKILFVYLFDVAIQSNLLSKPDFRIAFIKEMLPVIHQVIIGEELKKTQFKYVLPLSLQLVYFGSKLHESASNLQFNLWEILGMEEPSYLKRSAFQSRATENTYNLKNKDFKECQDLFNQYQQHPEQVIQKGQEEYRGERPKPSELKIIVMMLCTNLRTVQFVATKLVGLELLVHLSQYMTDYDILHVVLPFVCDQLEDFELQVAEYAFECFCLLLARLKDPFENINDTTLYKVFIWTNFQKCAKNMDIRRKFILNCIDLAKSSISLQNLAVHKKKKFVEDHFMNSSVILDVSYKNQTANRLAEYNLASEKQDKEIVDLIKDTFKRCLSECASDISNLAISQLPKFLDFLGADSERQNYMNLFISCLNRADRKLSCLESMFDIIMKIQDSQQKMFAVLCLKDCLNDQNELFAYTALNCSWRLVERGALEKAQVYEFLEQIAPLLLHPHNWIRNEATKYVGTAIAVSDPIQVFLEIQPKIIKYMTEEVAMLNRDILKLILPKKIDKKFIDYKNKKCIFTSSISDHESKKYLELFQNNYLVRVKSSKEQIKAIKEEEFKQFTQKFDVINSRQLYKQNFSKRLADFLILGFKCNFLAYIKMVGDKYRFTQGQYDDKQLDKLMLDYFKEQKITFDPQSYCVEINIELQKFLNQIFLQLSIDYDRCLSKVTLVANHNHKNFASSLVNLNEFILKLQQFEDQEEIDIGKPFFYDPSAPNISSSSLKVWHPQGQLVTTIYEHSDAVSSLESVNNNRHFLSASYDGTVRIYDVANLEQDFTSDSIAQIACKDEKDITSGKNHKVKVVKMIPDSSSVIIGTEKGNIYIYNIEKCADQKLSHDQRKRNIQTIYGQGEIRCLESFRNDTDKCFLFATSKGEVGVRDIRSKSVALTNNIGKERGLISSMILTPSSSSYTSSHMRNSFQNSSAVIGTLNGYCLMYDLRCNLMSHNYQLLNTEEEVLPILSLQNYYRYAQIEEMGKSSELLAISFASDNHEIAMFNLDGLEETMKPNVYMVSTEGYGTTFQPPHLRSLSKQENFKNCSNNSLKDVMEYDFIPHFSEHLDVLGYLKDPLMTNQHAAKLRWLERSNNCFANIQRVHECKNAVSKIICLPSHPLSQNTSLPKTVQNSIITCGNDRNVRLWPLTSDAPSKSNYQIDTQIKGFHVSNVDGQQRNYSQKKVANILVLHEYSRNSFQQTPVYAQAAKKKSTLEDLNYPTFAPSDKRCAHSDTISDMIYLEREQGALLVTGSRDKTVKIWK